MMASLPTSPAADRNKDPILAVLRGLLPDTGRVLEIASGTGQHIVHFAAALPAVSWQPTEFDAGRLAVIDARVTAAGLANVRPALELDVCCEPWPVAAGCAAVLCVNMIHIAPAPATGALLRGAAAALGDVGAGLLILYGPFRERGRHTAPSNAAFDASLRAENPAWGVRDLDAVAAQAASAGFAAPAVIRMPANNLCVAFRRDAGRGAG